MKNLKISTSLIISITSISVLMIGSFLFIGSTIIETLKKENIAIDNHIIQLKHVSDWAESTKLNLARATSGFVSKDNSVSDFYKDQIKETSEKITNLQKQISGYEFISIEEKKQLEEIGKLREKVLSERKNLQKQKDSGMDITVDNLNSVYIPITKQYIESIEVFVDIKKQKYKEMRDLFDSEIKMISTYALIWIIFLLVTLLMLTRKIISSIKNPLKYSGIRNLLFILH